MFKIGFLIYTYDRVDDARVNMELIHNLWQKTHLVDEVKIVHAYNGKKEWYSERYLEDQFVVIENSGHFQGAAELIDAGIATFKKEYNHLDYIFVLAGDTWLIKADYFLKVLEHMSRKKLCLAASSWGTEENNDIFENGIASDFFIIDFKWAIKNKLFPINYKVFSNRYGDLLLYLGGSNNTLGHILEKLIFSRFIKATFNEEGSNVNMRDLALSKMYRLTDREPVFSKKDTNGRFIMQKYWPEMGLVGYHNPRHKQAILKKMPGLVGKHIIRLIKSKNLSYFSKGAAGTKPIKR